MACRKRFHANRRRSSPGGPIVNFLLLVMTTVSSTSAVRNEARPRFGKDHLVLADWPIGSATFQRRRGDRGEQRDFAEFVIDRSDGTRQRVTLESPSRIGLPTAGDHDTLVALMLLAKQEEYQSDIVRFVPWQLLQILGWPGNQKSLRRLQASLKRLKAVTSTYENVWYSRRTRSVESCLITGILAEAKIVFRRGRRASGEPPESYVQWTRHMRASLEEGSVVDLDLDLYFSCRRPGTKCLLRHLNKVWHAGKKPRAYARDLKELACSHLGMTDCKDLKRNFHDLVVELESCGYLKPLDPSVRYQRIRNGIWRVNLELHPHQLRTKRPTVATAPKRHAASTSARSDAANLVCLYHRHRFVKADYVPRKHEIAHAKKLLQDHDSTTLAKVAASVAHTVERQYRGEDKFFGSAVPYFVAAAERNEKQQRARDRQADDEQREIDEDAAIMEQKRQRRIRRERLLRQWARLPGDERSKFRQQAIDTARSESDRRRISRSQIEDDPPREVLEAMDRHRSVSGSALGIAADFPPLPVTEAATEVPAAGGRPGNGSTMR